MGSAVDGSTPSVRISQVQQVGVFCCCFQFLSSAACTVLRLWGIIWVLCSLVFRLQNKQLYWLLAAVTSYREAGFVLAHGVEGCSPLWWEGTVTPARKRRKGNASAQLAFAFSSYIPLETLAHRISCHLIEGGSPAVKLL